MQREHAWNVTPPEAINIQNRLRPHVVTDDQVGTLRFIAGVDVGFENQGTTTRAAVVLLSFPACIRQEHIVARVPTTFPYVPGLLSFREIPAVLEALGQLNTPPDLIMCDGQGIAHPRRLGIASHLGVLTDLPTIGVAKSRLTGRHEPVDPEPGSFQPLLDGNAVVGTVLRTKLRSNPLYISIGHRVSLATAVGLVLQTLRGYRLPEPTRQAHNLASQRP
ncbi:MAG: deoxyribonuclease V [Herpetosiphon sp.]